MARWRRSSLFCTEGVLVKDVILVLAAALIGAALCERYLISRGAAKVTAAGGGGAAFLGLGSLGLLVLDYLAPTAC
ncbi:hypothetical protein DKG34_40370 [Streptomyces sp. NWU49]|nr:hypothetical protein DKG34_40370 [Streptomyces sp. NWU49]